MTLILNGILRTYIWLIFLLGKFVVDGMWPPPYKVNLSHEEIFEISEPLKRSDVQDVYDEEEMIKREEMEEMKMQPRKDKYFRIHQHARDRDQQQDNNYDFEKKDSAIEEFNPDIEESLPWKAGFVDENDKFIRDKGLDYFDEEASNDKDSEKQKRADSPKDANENYDYSNLKAEYNKEVKLAQKSKETLQYSTVKEDESVKDSIKSLVDFKKTPRNCTEEEMKGIGMGVLECFWMEANKPRAGNKYKLFEKALRVFIIWILIYALVAVPCWCQYGWCCCCCRCKFCSPLEQIDEIKKFAADNPVGVYHDEEGNEIKYKATNYEKYAQKKLEKEISRL